MVQVRPTIGKRYVPALILFLVDARKKRRNGPRRLLQYVEPEPFTHSRVWYSEYIYRI